MPNTYTQIYLHIVFAVKGRENIILDTWEEQLFKYISGIINNNKQKLYVINGYKDHIHLLVSISPDCKISDLIRDVKSSSTNWINENNFVKGRFYWQTGFSAFSVSQSQLKKTIQYIENQKIHHQKVSFKNEYISLLKAYEIEYDEKYIFIESSTPTEQGFLD
jgi:REP element-mobilizing transposase RayT